MSAVNAYVRRIFGGKSGDGEEGARRWNAANQADGEALAVATHSRMFKGPQRNGNWSYQAKATSAAGATSTLKFYYSDLPNPDPGTAAHWVDSGIAAIDLTATTTVFATITGKFPEWIMAQAVIANSGGQVYLWVRSEGVEV
jgi:hypothetical protein